MHIPTLTRPPRASRVFRANSTSLLLTDGALNCTCGSRPSTGGSSATPNLIERICGESRRRVKTPQGFDHAIPAPLAAQRSLRRALPLPTPSVSAGCRQISHSHLSSETTTRSTKARPSPPRPSPTSTRSPAPSAPDQETQLNRRGGWSVRRSGGQLRMTMTVTSASWVGPPITRRSPTSRAGAAGAATSGVRFGATACDTDKSARSSTGAASGLTNSTRLVPSAAGEQGQRRDHRGRARPPMGAGHRPSSCHPVWLPSRD